MKRLFTPVFCLLLLASHSVSFAQTTLTKEERSRALSHLKTTHSELLKSVKGLSETQLKFKPSEDAWSIAECMEHLAISESNLFGLVQATLQTEPDPSQRSEVSMSDDQLLAFIESRDQKVKTRKEFEPAQKFGGYEGSLEEFKLKRKSNIGYVKSSRDDLRNRYFDFPFAKADGYQLILFISGHTRRHTDQIKEIKANASFPGS